MINRYLFCTKFFILGIVLVPIYVFSYKLFNELIISLAFLYVIVMFSAAKYSKMDLMIIGAGIFFSACFMLINILKIDQNEFVFKDVVEGIKPVLFSCLVVCGRRVSARLTVRDFAYFVTLICLLQVGFSFLVYFPVFYDFVDLFKGRQSINSFNSHFFRFSGTMGFPSLFGIWVGLAMILNLVVPSLRYKGITFLILGCGLYFSQSRTGAAIFFISCILIYFSALKKNWDWRPELIHIILGFILFGMIFFAYLSQDNFSDKFSSAANDWSASSLGYRIRQFSNFINIFELNPLGIGSSNHYLNTNFGPIENVYFYYGVKFGVVGLIWYTLICVATFLLLVRFYRLSNFACFSICVWLAISLTVGSYSNAISLEYKSFVFFFVTLGIVLGWSKNPNSPSLSKLRPIFEK